MAIQFIGEQIKNGEITNNHLSGSVSDSKLLQITTANKVAGSALQLAGSGGLENDSGIKISALGVSNAMLEGSIAFEKLADAGNIARLDQNETVAGQYTFTSIPLCSVTPSQDTHIANKAYVDTVAQGLHPKESVKVATVANITLSGTQTIDGVAVSAGQRVLVRAQTDQTTNGVYTCAAGAWSRAADMNAGSEFPGASFFTREGSTFATTGFVCSNPSVSLGSTNITFVQYTGAGQITAGDGLAKSGNTISVDLSTASGLEFSGGKLQLDIAAAKAIQLVGNELSFVLNGSTLAQDGSGLKVNAGGITNNEINGSAAIADSKLAQIATADKVAGSAVQLGTGGALENDSGLKVKLDGSTLTKSVDGLKVGSITNNEIAGGAAIADSKLAQITTSDKVAGSAVQLKTNGGLADSSGLQVQTDGVNVRLSGSGAVELVPASITNAQIHASAAIADSKLAQIATADKVAGSAVELKSQGGLANDTGLKVNVDDVTVSLQSGALQVKDDGLALAKMAFRPKEDQFDISNGSTNSLNLSQRITIAAFRVAGNIVVFRNGQKLRFKSSPSDNSEFSISDNGSATSITFGAACANGDKIDICYLF